MNHLSFYVELSPVRKSHLQLLNVLPVIDGKSFLSTESNPCMNSADLLALQPWQELDLCTCTCGVPGCAGYHEEVQIREKGNSVQWTVPLCGYENVVDTKAFGNGPWHFVFSKEQQQQAVDDLAHRVENLLKAHDNIIFGLDEIQDEEAQDLAKVRGWTLDDFLKFRESTTRNLKWRREWSQVMEPLFESLTRKTLVIQVGSGCYRLQPYSLSWALAPEGMTYHHEPENSAQLLREAFSRWTRFTQALAQSDWRALDELELDQIELYMEALQDGVQAPELKPLMKAAGLVKISQAQIKWAPAELVAA